ncbi:hypothetical protein [Massilia sp. 9096]|uniref:hypothetical protein n=1 Tax=Massilia sp. 9096 TaxID=1500894 RepID=UPI0005649D27|nr:hypothetical protein [Massilia sp. 9096]
MANRKGWLWGGAFSAVTYLCGPLAPVIQYEFNLTHDAYVNAVWDCLYGIGFEIAFLLIGNITMSRFAGTLGVIVWPTILFWTMAYLVKQLYCAQSGMRYRAFLVIVFIGTLLFYVPLSSAGRSGRPTFSADAAVVY